MNTLNQELAIASNSEQTVLLARSIITTVMHFRRMMEGEEKCLASCTHCHSPHLAKVIRAINAQKPIEFVLPAFPGKSPNPSKVLGVMPDMAEKQALIFLNNLCKQIQAIYEPGAKVVICSDGRVFSDVVGISEAHISAYQAEIDRLISVLELTALSTFNLDDVYLDVSFEIARADLMANYGQNLEALKEKVKRGSKESADADAKEANRMYLGLTRFLVEDAMYPGQVKSRTTIQKECKRNAYQAIIRSNAWTDLIAEKFPEALRLSIHPQICGSRKIGIQLLGVETWMTPWHGVALNTGKHYVLMKHKEVQELAVNLVADAQGRPSHYVLVEPSEIQSR